MKVFLKVLFNYYFVCMSVFFSCMNVSTPFICLALVKTGRGYYLEVESDAMSCHVGAGNQTWAVWQRTSLQPQPMMLDSIKTY